MQNLEQSEGKSYGVREEHRVTVELMGHMIEELSSRGQRPVQSHPAAPCPWWTIPTRHAVSFVQFNLIRFALPFETIRMRLQGRQISWTQTKMMVMLLRGLRVALDHSILPRQGALWKHKGRPNDNFPTGQRGMDFKRMWEDFNYCWSGPGLIDWARLDWKQDVRDVMLFNDNALFNAYKRRWQLVQNVTEMHRGVDELRAHLVRHKNDTRIVQGICRYFTRECSTSYRIWAWGYFAKSMIFLSPDDRVACLTGRVPLCIPEIEARANGDLFHWKFPKPTPRKQPGILDLLELIWGFDDDMSREWKAVYPFRNFIRYCCQVLDDTVGREARSQWFKSFLVEFCKHNNTLPRPTRHHMVLRDSKDTQDPKRTNWMTVNWLSTMEEQQWPVLCTPGYQIPWRIGSEKDYTVKAPEPKDGPGASFAETKEWLREHSQVMAV